MTKLWIPLLHRRRWSSHGNNQCGVFVQRSSSAPTHLNLCGFLKKNEWSNAFSSVWLFCRKDCRYYTRKGFRTLLHLCESLDVFVYSALFNLELLELQRSPHRPTRVASTIAAAKAQRHAGEEVKWSISTNLIPQKSTSAQHDVVTGPPCHMPENKSPNPSTRLP